MSRIMVLDAEFNQPSRKTIEIGAAVYDVRNAVCYGTFETYVNPGEPITEMITNLTGITDKDVESAPSINEAWLQLQDFHAKHRCFRNPLVWGSGYRNDSSAIHQEVLATGVECENFMGFRVLDAKTLYQSIQLFENESYAGGLDQSMKRLGLSFEGMKHRALTDAKNTFTIWYHLVRKMHDGFKAKK